MTPEPASAARPGTGWLRRLAWLIPALLLVAAAIDPRLPVDGPTWNYMVVIDITQSMNTRDVQVDGQPIARLAAAKEVMRRLLSRMPCGSKIGWGVFTEYRVLALTAPAEVCDNYHDLRGVLSNIDGRMSWAGASEVSKGLFSAIRSAEAIEDQPALLFLTDGHEAPPLHPDHLPKFDGAAGRVAGYLVGLGGDGLSPIPKNDLAGKPLGVWRADEVMQNDTFSQGRGTNDALVDENGRPMPVRPGSGVEHLSSLKEDNLRRLSELTGLHYVRLHDTESLARAVLSGETAMVRRTTRAVGWMIGAGALVILLLLYLRPGPHGRKKAFAN